MQNFQNICKRAGGRREYNATRRSLANERKLEVIKLMRLWGWSNTNQTYVQAIAILKPANSVAVARVVLQNNKPREL